MTTFTYTGTLTDIRLGVLAGAHPEMTVRPVEEAFGPAGLVSAVPVPVSVNPATGAFSMTLVPSGELKGVSGRVGVEYIIQVGRFEEPIGGSSFAGLDVWRFTAVAGGGNVGDMVGGSLLAVWVGPPWPARPFPAGLYIDREPPNAWGIVT